MIVAVVEWLWWWRWCGRSMLIMVRMCFLKTKNQIHKIFFGFDNECKIVLELNLKPIQLKFCQMCFILKIIFKI